MLYSSSLTYMTVSGWSARLFLCMLYSSSLTYMNVSGWCAHLFSVCYIVVAWPIWMFQVEVHISSLYCIIRCTSFLCMLYSSSLTYLNLSGRCACLFSVWYYYSSLTYMNLSGWCACLCSVWSYHTVWACIGSDSILWCWTKQC